MNKSNRQTSWTSKPKTEKVVLLPDVGKLPPQAQELEEAILGALMVEATIYPTIGDILEADNFYNPANSIIYAAIQALAARRNPIDVHTVLEELKQRGELEQAGGVVYVAELSDKVSAGAHAEYHALIIKQKAVARKLIEQSYNVMNMAFDETVDVQDTIEYLEKSFTELRSGSNSSGYYEMRQAIVETLTDLANIQERRKQGETVGIQTGLNALDNVLYGGWIAPDLIVLGGRPSMGKTQFALHFAKSAAKNGNHCLFVSIEMTAKQLIKRLLIEDERLTLNSMQKGEMKDEEWRCIDQKIAEIESLKLNIADSHNIRYIGNIKSLARKLKRAEKLDILIIDYLQLIRTNQSFGTRDIEIGYITGELKNLAKELNIPIILLAQLSRPVKGTKVMIPQLSDLRESGNIEQDADKVIYPHRPTYYDKSAKQPNGDSWENRGVLIIAKNREGILNEKVYFRHDDRFKKIFDDYSYSGGITESENSNNSLPF
jgi:replicative DNA helicase